jgi:hypothetical protein
MNSARAKAFRLSVPAEGDEAGRQALLIHELASKCARQLCSEAHTSEKNVRACCATAGFERNDEGRRALQRVLGSGACRGRALKTARSTGSAAYGARRVLPAPIWNLRPGENRRGAGLISERGFWLLAVLRFTRRNRLTARQHRRSSHGCRPRTQQAMQRCPVRHANASV